MIVIIDYGLGNIKAFSNILQRKNFDFRIAKNEEDLKGASKIILPGVGSFDGAIDALNKSGMRTTLDELVLEKKIEVLGICVGMQIMCKSSKEGTKQGLGWIDAEVKKIEEKDLYPLPHMGWNTLHVKKDDKIFNDIISDSEFYFLHSYYIESENKFVIAYSDYSCEIASVIKNENIYGIQCHPEKSHKNGEIFLENFVR